MQRESILFYRSFYEAIRIMPLEVQAELYPAIMEYGLYGTFPDQLSDIAKGVFLLIKPVLDANTARYENSKKGGRKRKTISDSTVPKATPSVKSAKTEAHSDKIVQPARETDVNQTTESESPFKQEAASMHADKEWIQSISKKFSLTEADVHDRIDGFQLHCITDRPDKPHKNLTDARRHFCHWMRKTKTETKTRAPAKLSSHTKADSDFKGDDFLKRARQLAADNHPESHVSDYPNEIIRRFGYNPEKVTFVQICNPQWRAENPPATQNNTDPPPTSQ